MISSAEVLKLPAREIQPTSQWRSLPDASTPRLMMAWAVLNDKIWIMGGLRNGVPLQTVESYDPRTRAWETGPPLPIPLHHAAAATYRGEVVVLGGASENIAADPRRPRRDGRYARFQVRADRETFSLRALLEPLEPVLV